MVSKEKACLSVPLQCSLAIELSPAFKSMPFKRSLIIDSVLEMLTDSGIWPGHISHIIWSNWYIWTRWFTEKSGSVWVISIYLRALGSHSVKLDTRPPLSYYFNCCIYRHVTLYLVKIYSSIGRICRLWDAAIVQMFQLNPVLPYRLVHI